MNKRILVVDDNRLYQLGITTYLTRQGYENIQCADTGKECIDKVRDSKPDLVILDIVLPDMNGFDVCKRIKDMGIDTKVLVITGVIDAVDGIQARSVGADNLVVKTEDFSVLQKEVQELLN